MTRRVAHVRCGSDLRDALAVAGLLGTEDLYLETHDPVCEGPLLADDRRALDVRARWLSRAWELDEDETRGRLQRHRRLGEEVADADEICLWFEHDLYDQSALVELLARLDASGAGASLLPRMRLVTLDGHPSVGRFIGLGQLRPDALPGLYEARVPMTAAHLEVAGQVWASLCSEDPRRLMAVEGGEAFPYLRRALRVHLAELPGVQDGLGAVDRRVVHALRGAPRLAIELFQEELASAPDPWLGDLMFWARLRALAAPDAPLLEMTGVFPAEQLRLTDLGYAVAAGELDWLSRAPPGPFEPRRFRGGVESDPSRAHWRWDPAQGPVSVEATFHP